SWLTALFNMMYFNSREVNIITDYSIDTADKYEKWLNTNESTLAKDSLLITGLVSYVHYGCHACGFRLNFFKDKLSPKWKLIKEYDRLSYMQSPEKVRLWLKTAD
ncbi:MAG: hypothetical protein KBC84_01445, partial [Proteobacteria bacterium]|nr:hypothetical protein [Pseudomonadota bacterium]